MRQPVGLSHSDSPPLTVANTGAQGQSEPTLFIALDGAGRCNAHCVSEMDVHGCTSSIGISQVPGESVYGDL